MKILKIDDEFIVADKIISFCIHEHPLGSTIFLNLIGNDEVLTLSVSENRKNAEEKMIWALTLDDYFDWNSFEWKKGE